MIRKTPSLTAKQIRHSRLYKFTGLCYPTRKDIPAIGIIDSDGHKYAASFPNGPNEFTDHATLIKRMRWAINNLEMMLSMKEDGI